MSLLICLSIDVTDSAAGPPGSMAAASAGAGAWAAAWTAAAGVGTVVDTRAQCGASAAHSFVQVG